MQRAANKALLDTNVLLLWLVIETDLRLLEQFKRVQEFSQSDANLLLTIMKQFRGLVTTPHVLTETSNFLRHAPVWARDALFSKLAFFACDVAELYQPASELVKSDAFRSLGLTDAGLIALGHEAVIITMDFALSGKVESLGGRVMNFNHQRSAGLLSH